ncbi:heme peroxidase [Mycena olivaceomarginata]|nr:heme peroxidase [Mycena olivaceomarginata]
MVFPSITRIRRRLKSIFATPLSLLITGGTLTRDQLHLKNLHDTYLPGEFPVRTCDGVNTGQFSRSSNKKKSKTGERKSSAARTLDGLCNHLENPGMGAIGTRFSRFVPINTTWGETEADTLFTPNPRKISQHLLKRKSFTPATSINLLAATWIQFQTHGWFSHGLTNDPHNLMTFELPLDDPLRPGQTQMSVKRGLGKESHDGRPDTFINTNTHWWDLSSIYGSDEATYARLRSYVDGKMKVDANGLLPVGSDGIDITGFSDNYWAVICRGATRKPTTTPVSSPPLSTPKSHTVEWTPALLQNEVLLHGMKANWHSLLAEWLFIPGPVKRFLGRFVPQTVSEALFGIVGGSPNFAGVPFSHSEEFDVIHDNRFSDVVFTFGVDYPGALILNNFPEGLMSLNKPGEEQVLDMGAIDVLRDRERGIPRYNEFRRRFSLIPAKTLAEISDDPAAVEALRAVVRRRRRERGPAARDARREPARDGLSLNSKALDWGRPLTNNDQYTKEGLAWVHDSDFRAVIARTVPELKTAVYTVDNAFKPWVIPRWPDMDVDLIIIGHY